MTNLLLIFNTDGFISRDIILGFSGIVCIVHTQTAVEASPI